MKRGGEKRRSSTKNQAASVHSQQDRIKYQNFLSENTDPEAAANMQTEDAELKSYISQ